MIAPLRALNYDPLRRPSWRRIVGSILCVILTGVMGIDIHYSFPRDDGSLRQIQAAHVWRIGMDISDPPFASEPDKHPVGLDADLAHALADRLGVAIQIVPLGYDGLYDALKVGGVDGVISALTVDPLRLNDVHYSVAYFDDGLVLIAPPRAAINAMTDLDGKRVATEAGSLADQEAQHWQRRLHRLSDQTYPTANTALDAVRNGMVDAALTDSVTARLYLRTNPAAGIVISPDFVTHQPYSVAVRHSSIQLAEAIDAALKSMQADGSLSQIAARWLDAPHD